MPAPRKVVLHAGFHKTGTTSAQSTLLANGKQIWPRHALVLPRHVADVTALATLHSGLRDPVSLRGFRRDLAAHLRGLSYGEKRGLCLSAEDIAGLIPGRSDRWSYAAAPELIASACAAIRAAMPPCRITVVLSLREAESWIGSTYWQNLRRSRMRLGFAAYRERLLPHADLEAVAHEIATRIAPIPVEYAWLEETSLLPLGPAEPILKALGIGPRLRAQMTAAPVRNPSPDAAAIDEMLALNRAELDEATLDARKAELLERIRARRVASGSPANMREP